MNTQHLGGFAQQFGARLRAVKRRTWVIVGLMLALLFGLAVWAVIALASFFWGQTQTLVAGVPELAREASRVAAAQVGVLLPTAEEKLAQIKAQLPNVAVALPTIPGIAAAMPAADVAGSDLGPQRLPGLIRTRWLKRANGSEADYQGWVDYAQARQHYVQGFTALGFSHSVLAGTVASETHEFVKANERMTLILNQGPALSAAEALARSALGQPTQPMVTVNISVNAPG